MRTMCRPAEELELYAYGFLEGAEKAAVEAHLRTCPRCRAAAEGLHHEREIVAFELGMAAAEAARPRRRRLVPWLVAAAASLVALAALGGWLLRGAGDSPELDGWRSLADGSRYRVVEEAEVREPKIRRLELDEGSLVLDVRPDDEEFQIATPHGAVRSDGGKLALSVSPTGTVVEVLEGTASFEAKSNGLVIPGPDPDVRILVLELDPDPDLLARIRELEEKLAALGELPDREDESPPPTPEEAIERHDWKRLAASLLETAPDRRLGRLPRDPEAVRRYLRSLEAIQELAAATGIEPTMESIAKDPRTGSRLFAETLSQLWPDAPEVDLATAREEAAVALERHQRETAMAETSAERTAAEEALRSDLTEQVERFEETHGPAEVPVSPVDVTQPDVRTPPATNDDPAPPSVEPAPEETGPNTPPPDDPKDPPTSKELSAVDTVVDSVSPRPATTRVRRGTPAQLIRAIVRDWRRDRGYRAADEPVLDGLARDWLRAYDTVRSAAPRAVVTAFELELRGGTAPADVSRSKLSRLRTEFLKVQAAAEKRLPPAPRDASSVPTFFLIE